ncbi:hypothetical protein CAT7_01260 [Carnobacterium sp. AT7]|uniref:hypothetical protein n=1 Tax=Carnobacterium TaxID=2747 RepID=UPI00015EF52A|nr:MULTISPECIES: hypothetical protein [Carnobacterium]EDP67425.1 hypothetical protein CAT7_01260 [Carnobacterium sp. AT7]
MKKTSKSRMKKLPILLGTLLIISVAAYGTRAFFSNSADIQGDIQLSLGDVKISTENTTDWKYEPIATTTSKLDVNDKLGANVASDGSIADAGNITNVRPGDSFTKTYIIENTGSLDTKVNLKLANIPVPLSSVKNDVNYSDGPFTIKIHDLEENFNLEGKKDGIVDKKEFTVTITVDPTVADSYNPSHKEFLPGNKTTVNYLKNVFSVNAVQTNKK